MHPRWIHPALIQEHLERKVEDQRKLLARTPLLGDLQSAWLILLHCAAAWANYLLRVAEPQDVATSARAHDEGWASLADCSPMIFARHPEVALSFVQLLQGLPETPFLSAAASSARALNRHNGV